MSDKDKYSKNLFKKKLSGSLSYVFRILFLLVVGNIVIYPFFYMLSYSFKDFDALLDVEHMWVPIKLSFQNYAFMMGIMDFWTAFKQTISVQIVSAAIEVFVCGFVAYGFARFQFKGKKILTFFLILSLLVPIQLYSLSMSVNFRNFHIFNTPFVYWLPSMLGVGIRSGMIIFIYQQFFIGLPKELEEAAFIDGAGPVKTYFRIALPSSGVVILSVSVLAFVWHWNEYYLANLCFISDDAPLAMKMSNLSALLQQAGVWENMPQFTTNVSAACIIYILLPLALYMIFQRKFVRSIDRVGITG